MDDGCHFCRGGRGRNRPGHSRAKQQKGETVGKTGKNSTRLESLIPLVVTREAVAKVVIVVRQAHRERKMINDCKFPVVFPEWWPVEASFRTDLFLHLFGAFYDPFTA